MAPSSSHERFTTADRQQLENHGLTLEEARRQVEYLRGPARFTRLDRPCTIGDGIDVIADDRVEELVDLHRRASDEGRCSRFVPASGAATRMFKSLLSGETEELRTFIEGIDRFAFAADLQRAVADGGNDLHELIGRGAFEPILDALLSSEGMGYAHLPKALIKFHASREGGRTPFEEHLVEAAPLLRDSGGRCRLHFTVSPSHVGAFSSLLERARDRYERSMGVTYDVEFSMQKPSTDTLAVDSEGRPFRLPDGSLLLRPAGHGALLENLNDLEADIVLIKNIDNVVPDRLKEATYLWSRLLTGRLVKVQREAFALLRRLEDRACDNRVVEEALSFVRDVLHVDCRAGSPEENREDVTRLLDRPIRVCGMVKNVGEPGGGPFWVRDSDGGFSLQIVENAQVDHGSEQQQGLMARSTHFNPVYLVCGVRTHRGEPHDLRRYVDPDTAIVTRKSSGGRELKALERPGLWNGSMASWNTIFVEVPGQVFSPVKTVNALLRPEHQPV